MKDLFTQTAFVFYGIALLSMLLHAVKKWLEGGIRGSLIDWYICAPKRTASAVLACLSGVATLILGGVVFDYNIGSHIAAVAGAGFAADTLNSQGKIK
jgi:hypothetical protein